MATIFNVYDEGNRKAKETTLMRETSWRYKPVCHSPPWLKLCNKSNMSNYAFIYVLHKERGTKQSM